MNQSVALAGRILLAAIFLISAVGKIKAFPMVAAMMAGKGFPMAEIFLVAAITLELVGGVMLIANIQARYVAWALAAFTLVSGIIFHGFWNAWNAAPQVYTNELNHFLKNIAIVGGLLMVAAVEKPDGKRA